MSLHPMNMFLSTQNNSEATLESARQLYDSLANLGQEQKEALNTLLEMAMESGWESGFEQAETHFNDSSNY